MKRFSRVSSDTIEASLWLIFKADGNVRMTRGAPDLSRDERAVALTVTLPRALFTTPTLKASLVVDAPAMPLPTIDLHAVGEALRQAIGVDVDIRVAE